MTQHAAHIERQTMVGGEDAFPAEVEPTSELSDGLSGAAEGPVALPVTGQGVRPADFAGDLEAMLITSGRPVPVMRLAVALGLAANEDAAAAAADGLGAMGLGVGERQPGEQETARAEPTAKKRKKRRGHPHDPAVLISEAVELLNEVYERTHRSFRISLVAGGYRMMTGAAHALAVSTLHGLGARQKLSKSAVETLAIIAYKQPVTRATLEAIRGVACGEVLKTLLERRLITIAGRAEELGRPILYGTSKAFLEAFGLANLRDLPSPAELSAKAERAADSAHGKAATAND